MRNTMTGSLTGREMGQPSIKCWEDGAKCGECELSLVGSNTTIIFSLTDTMALGVIASILSVLGTLLNSVTIAALLSSARVRAMVTTPFVLSLNTADLLFSILSLSILAIRFFTRDWDSVLGETFCKIHPFFFYGVLGASVLSLMFVTVNRACILFFQEKVQKIFTWKVNICVVAISWFVPMVFLIPSLSGSWGKMGLNEYTQSCTILKDDEGDSPKNLFQTLFVIIPVVVMIVSNIAIVIKVKCIDVNESDDENKTAENLFLLTLFTVFAFFLLAFLPKLIVESVDKCFMHPSVFAVVYIINWLRVIIDPVVFLVTQQSYMSAVKGMFKRICISFPSDDEADGHAKREEGQSMRIEAFKRISTDGDSIN